jgi:hypothetical protein
MLRAFLHSESYYTGTAKSVEEIGGNLYNLDTHEIFKKCTLSDYKVFGVRIALSRTVGHFPENLNYADRMRLVTQPALMKYLRGQCMCPELLVSCFTWFHARLIASYSRTFAGPMGDEQTDLLSIMDNIDYDRLRQIPEKAFDELLRDMVTSFLDAYHQSMCVILTNRYSDTKHDKHMEPLDCTRKLPKGEEDMRRHALEARLVDKSPFLHHQRTRDKKIVETSSIGKRAVLDNNKMNNKTTTKQQQLYSQENLHFCFPHGSQNVRITGRTGSNRGGDG